MNETISAYPLQWPAGWQRTKISDLQHGRFSKKVSRQTSGGGSYHGAANLSVSDGVKRVIESLERMSIDLDDVVISSDLKLRLDGLPRSNQSEPDDQGVCVYWQTSKKERRCMAIDRYWRIADNIAAISATLEAMRLIERHGGAKILDRAFTAFIALPGPEQEPWWSVLGFYSEAEALFQGDFEIKAKKMLQDCHPDKENADEWKFKQVIKARDEGRELRKNAD